MLNDKEGVVSSKGVGSEGGGREWGMDFDGAIDGKYA